MEPLSFRPNVSSLWERNSTCGAFGRYWHFSAVPAVPINVRFQGVNQPCRRNLKTAEFDPGADVGPNTQRLACYGCVMPALSTIGARRSRSLRI